MNNRPAEHITCPYTGHKQKCLKHYLNCPKWIQVIGVDPNTGQETNQYQCEDSWRPKFSMEMANASRQIAATIESFRNEVVQIDLGRQIAQALFALAEKNKQIHRGKSNQKQQLDNLDNKV